MESLNVSGINYSRQIQAEIHDIRSIIQHKRHAWITAKRQPNEKFQRLAKPSFMRILTLTAELKNIKPGKKEHIKKNQQQYKNHKFEIKHEYKLDGNEIQTEAKLKLSKVQVNYQRALREFKEAIKQGKPGAKEKQETFTKEYESYLVTFKTELDHETKANLNALKEAYEQKLQDAREACEKAKIAIEEQFGTSIMKKMMAEKKADIKEEKQKINVLRQQKKQEVAEISAHVNQLKQTYLNDRKQLHKEIKAIKEKAKKYVLTLSSTEQAAYKKEQKNVKQDRISEIRTSADQFEHRMFKHVNPAYIYVTPAIFSALFFTVLPFIFMLVASMFRVDLTSLGNSTFKGFNNFVTIFTLDREFQLALTNTLIYALITVVLLLVVTIGMAAWLAKNTRVHNAAQTMVFTPHIASLVAISILWIALLHPTGIINQLLALFGIEGPGWLIQENTSLFAISMVTVWKDIGYYALIIISGLQSIPNYVYEAAKLDKASKAKAFFTITLPLLMPTLSFVFVNKFITSFKVFAPIEIMTNCGPMGSSIVLSYWIYKVGRIGYNYGFAMAGAIILTILTASFTWANWKFLNRKVTY